MQRILFFSVREKYQEKNLIAEYLLSCGKNNAFNMKTVFKYTVDCKLGSSQCNQRGPWIEINGQLAVCFSKLLDFIQCNISV